MDEENKIGVEFDKVRLSEEQEHRLMSKMNGSEDDGEVIEDMLVSAISIEEALYLLSTDSHYHVESRHETFMCKPIISYYLMNSDNPNEMRWIVYK